MKRIMKSMLAVVLVFAMILPMGLSGSAASGAAVPTVYVQGQGSILFDAQGNQIYPLNLPDGYIMSVVEECMPLFIDALTLGKYEEWYAKLREEVIPLFEDIQLDKNGEISDGSHVWFNWSYNSIKGPSAVYSIRDYVFENDWRLDPFANAEVLHRYITDIITKTGADKVNLIGRCEGTNIVLAYLDAYGYDHINCVQFYVQSANGVDAASAAFSGNIKFDTASLEDWLNANVEMEDDLLAELLYSFISLAQSTYTLPALAGILNMFADKLYDEVMPDLLLNSFGSFPGIWAMVNSEDYEDAKNVIFGGREEEYAGLIEKIDHYNVRVRQRVDEIILEGKQAGVRFATIAKYGEIGIPLDETAGELSDGIVTLSNAGFGITCAPRGEILSEKYIETLRANGKDIYLSPDKNIDASTGLIADTTWIIKNSEHKNFPTSENALMEKFMHSNGEMTVFTDPAYPQYLIFDETDGSLTPYTGVPLEDVVDEPMSIRDYCLRFVNAIIAFVVRYLSEIFPGLFVTE